MCGCKAYRNKQTTADANRQHEVKPWMGKLLGQGNDRIVYEITDLTVLKVGDHRDEVRFAALYPDLMTGVKASGRAIVTFFTGSAWPNALRS